MTHRHGLMIGKFYPPHRGHHAAIRRGAGHCARFTVLVMASAAETVALDDRIAWLSAEHADDPRVQVIGVRCDAPVDVGDEQVWVAQTAAMRAALALARPKRPDVDVIVSHDAYGGELARRFGAAWLRLDRPAGEPSATAVRADLPARWTDLAPATRAGLATRIVVLGAESTGTTTVAVALAEHYRSLGGVWASTGCVEEYGREHTVTKWAAECAAAQARDLRPPQLDEIAWGAADFDVVAAEQSRREDQAAAAGSPVLVCDTDAFATSVWERRYLAASARPAPPWAQAPLLPRHHLYLLTDHTDVPWHDDGLREGDLAVRAQMTGWFIRALTAAGHSWVLLTGTLEQRTALAVRSTDPLLEHRQRFGEPLHGPGFEAPAP